MSEDDFGKPVPVARFRMQPSMLGKWENDFCACPSYLN
jgi:hypothetical protein